jgi:hypothetical protein
MDLVAGAASAVAGALLHKKGKLVLVTAKGGDGGGIGAALGAAANALSPLPIPGLGSEDKDDELTFMFNPTEYRLQQTANVVRELDVWSPGGFAEYQGTGPLSLSMQLFFDDFASAKGDVTPKINKLFGWQKPTAIGEPPPLVKFEWGTNKALTDFEGVITTLVANYTVFNMGGTPIQAKVDITLEGAKGMKVGKNPTSHARDMRRVHVVVEGETLASVANAELGQPGLWRAIAEVNGIDDPLRVRPGQGLFIPSVADATKLA